MKLSSGAKAVYDVADRMGFDKIEMADLEIIINTMEVMESKKKR